MKKQFLSDEEKIEKVREWQRLHEELDMNRAQAAKELKINLSTLNTWQYRLVNLPKKNKANVTEEQAPNPTLEENYARALRKIANLEFLMELCLKELDIEKTK